MWCDRCSVGTLELGFECEPSLRKDSRAGCSSKVPLFCCPSRKASGSGGPLRRTEDAHCEAGRLPWTWNQRPLPRTHSGAPNPTQRREPLAPLTFSFVYRGALGLAFGGSTLFRPLTSRQLLGPGALPAGAPKGHPHPSSWRSVYRKQGLPLVSVSLRKPVRACPRYQLR